MSTESPHRPSQGLTLALWAFLTVVITSLWSTSIFVAPARAAAVSPCVTNVVAWTTTQEFAPGTFCLVNGPDSMVFQTDGNLVWYVNSAALWSSGTAGTGRTLALQGDGNVVVYSASGRALYASSWDYNMARSTTPDQQKDLKIRVLENEHSVEHVTYFDSTYGLGSALSGLDHIDWGAEGANCSVKNGLVFLKSPERSFPAGQFCWATDSGTLVFQSDGNLVDYVAGVARWSSGTWGRGARLAIQMDGNIVIYSATGAPVWALSWQAKDWSARDLTHNNGWIWIQMTATHQIQLGVVDNKHTQAITWTV